MARMKSDGGSVGSKPSLAKKDVATKFRKQKDFWIGCKVRYKDYKIKVNSEEMCKLIGAKSFKKDIYGQIEAKSTTSPYHWHVQIDSDIGGLKVEDKKLSMHPRKQKNLLFQKKPSNLTTTFYTLRTAKQEQIPGHSLDCVQLKSNPTVQWQGQTASKVDVKDSLLCQGVLQSCVLPTNMQQEILWGCFHLYWHDGNEKATND